MDNHQKIHAGFTLGIMAGVTLTGIIYSLPTPSNTARTYFYEGKTIFRTQEELKQNQTYIQSTNYSNHFVTLDVYLDSLKNKNERILEESNILKVLSKN